MSRPPTLVSLATALPPHVARQEDARGLAARLFPETVAGDPRLLQVFENARIEKRHVCMPLEWYGQEHSFAEKNDLYVRHAVRLAGEVTERALERAGLSPRDVDHVVFVSTTGLATPSVDARLANELGFRSGVRRTPIWGLGCAGGAAGLSHARDFALADPSARVLLIALELCSLTFQPGDRSKRNLIATSLFGDGAAAAVITGGGVGHAGRNGRPPLEILASRSVLWKDTEDVMGWSVDGAGLHVIFSRDIPTIVRDQVRPSLLEFLEEQGLSVDAVHLAAHPGGQRVLHAYAEALGLPAEAFRHARDVLRDCGNMSSPSCLFVLERFLDSGDLRASEAVVVAALGPGFSAEYALLRAAGT